MSKPPVLTAEQRAKGLELRRKRAVIKAHIRTWGHVGVYDLWGMETVQGMKVRSLLTAIKGIGPHKARLLLEQAGIPAGNTVRRCGQKQKERLFAALADRK